MVAKKKAKKKAAGPWSKDEIELLKKLYPAGSIKEILDKTGRSLPSVRYRAFRLGIKSKRARQVLADWTADEIKLLKKLYPTTNNNEIATRLGRPVRSVRTKAFFLDLQKKSQ